MSTLDKMADGPIIFFADELTDEDEAGGTTTLHLVEPHVISRYPDGIWVKFRKEISWGEESELNGAMIRGVQRDQLVKASDITDETERMTTLIDVRHQRMLRAAVHIHSWNLPMRKDGGIRALPADINQRMAILSKLRPQWGKMINDKIEEIRKDDEELAEAQGMPEVRDEFGTASNDAEVPEGNGRPGPLPGPVIDIGLPAIEVAK